MKFHIQVQFKVLSGFEKKMSFNHCPSISLQNILVVMTTNKKSPIIPKSDLAGGVPTKH